MPDCLATPAMSSSVCGRNSCSGGSSRRMVTGRPAMMRKMSDEVLALHRAAACRAPCGGRARCRRGSSRARRGCASASKNMCSVRQRPMPSAPNLRGGLGVERRFGVGADFSCGGPRRPSPSARRSRRPAAGSTIFTEPTRTSPLAPSTVMMSPFLSVREPTRTVPRFGVDLE